jgi:hypothetical protein
LAYTADEPRRRKLLALLPLVPAAIWLVIWTRAPTTRPMGSVATAVPTGPGWQPPLQQIRDLLRFGNVIHGRSDEVFVALVFLIWVLLWLAPGTRILPHRRYRLPLLAVGLFCAYMVAPVQIGYVAYIHLRAMPFLIAFGLFSITIAKTRRTSALLGALVVLQAAYAARLAVAYRQFDREAEATKFEEVLSVAEPGRRVVSLMLNRKSRIVLFEPYLHFGLYYQIERGGRVRFNFGELPWMPVRLRGDRPPQAMPLHWEFFPGFFDWRRARVDADYVLVRAPDPLGDSAEDPEPGPEFAAGWELVKRAGRWSMFRPAR